VARQYRYIFGPVPSRRLGRSLGVDLTPVKTCSLNCVFCQAGRTHQHTRVRSEYVPTDDVVGELGAWMESDCKTDVVSLAGSGEPTLHTGFGRILEFIAAEMRLPAVLLSNGTTFDLPEVRRDAIRADIVKVSLSACDQDSFERVNRPAEGIRLDRIVEGYRAFRKEYKGQLWIEVFLVPGLNTKSEQVAGIAAVCGTIGADRIHLNTAVRPPAEQGVAALPEDRMEELAGLFHPRAEVASRFRPAGGDAPEPAPERILAMISRRPCTAGQIALLHGMKPEAALKIMENLVGRGAARREATRDEVYYSTRTGD
jgi:wyosine [tRNA(Phe)-imidazoG37] synthetase (radical SAM superfamily)